jgi:hypothetical protein
MYGSEGKDSEVWRVALTGEQLPADVAAKDAGPGDGSSGARAGSGDGAAADGAGHTSSASGGGHRTLGLGSAAVVVLLCLGLARVLRRRR